jgi:hypothetical protein
MLFHVDVSMHTAKQIEHWPVHKKTCGKTAAELQEQAVEDTADAASASGGSTSQAQTGVVVPLVAPHGMFATMMNKQIGTTAMNDPNKVPRNSHGDKRCVLQWLHLIQELSCCYSTLLFYSFVEC